MSDDRRKQLLKQAVLKIERLEAELRRAREPLAVVGVGCRFPGGADDPDRFWEKLLDGFDATAEIPADRWDVDAYFDPDPDARGRMYTRRGGFLTCPVDRFDPQFFGIAPREADEMDPQQRLLLEVVWETLERAGQAPDRLAGTATGVFLGMSTHDWAQMQGGAGETAHIDTYYGTGVAHSVAAGRLAYVLGTRGPAVTIDTACSSSLVAFHEACQSLRAGETRMAIAAGVCLVLSPLGHVIASRGRMLAPDGRCKTFDARADGYARGEGCGVVLLKRLADARADGDRILALVRGTATNQDGRSGGLTAPSGTAQEDVMHAALAAAGLAPGDLDYVETHGTGTELGDPIEVQALGAVHGANRDAARPLWIGSVKTNVGHLESAAGIAGLIKTVLALRAGTIPPHLHFETPNPHIPWDRCPVRVPTAPVPWPGDGTRRIAGVSSFGFSGTNAHAILEAAPAEVPAASIAASRDASSGTEAPPCCVVPLSARTPAALRELAARLAERVAADPALDARAVAATLARGRAAWEHRAAPVVRDRDGLLAALRAIAAGETAGIAAGEANVKRPPRVAFLFTGQGAQRLGMGAELDRREPAFRAALDRCDAALRPALGDSIRAWIHAAESDAARARLDRTEIAQPALFALEYALAALWRSWGVEPSIVLGHSVGEYVAATVAGVLEVDDALRLIAERGARMGALPAGGAMAAVFAGEAEARAAIGDRAATVAVAALNGPEHTVLSGAAEDLDAVLARLEAGGVKHRRLSVSHAFHSPLMEPMLEGFREVAADATCRPPRIDVVANRTGALADASTFDADAWTAHVREPVRFLESVATLAAQKPGVLIEIGPSPTLLGMAARCPGVADGPAAAAARLPSLRPGRDESETLAAALAEAWVRGVPVDGRGLFPDAGPPLELPTYPFQRERHWLPASKTRPRAARPAGAHPLLGRRLESPRLDDAIFECEVAADAPDWIAEHRVFERPVLPASAYLELGAAAARATLGEGAHRVAGLAIREPLVLEGEAPRTLQTVLRRDGGALEIYSRGAAGEGWTLHASGRIAAATAPAPAAATAPDGPSRSSEPAARDVAAGAPAIDADAYRESVRRAGVDYGPRFAGLRAIRRADGAAVAEIDAAAAGAGAGDYLLHPGLLDACFQLCGVALQDPRESSDAVYLPVGVDGYRVLGTLDGDGVCRAALREGSGTGGDASETFACDVALERADGTPVARVEGLRFKRADRAALRRAMGAGAADALYEIEWTPVDPPRAAPGDGRWALLAAPGDDAAGAVRAALEGAGRTVVEVADASAVAAAAAADGEWEGVVWCAAFPPPGDAGPAERLRPALEGLLGLARAGVGRLSVVTRGAQTVRPGHERVDPAGAAVWALGQTIASESADGLCRRIDLDPAGPAGAGQLAGALLGGGREDRLALRGDETRVARLVRFRGDLAGAPQLAVPDDGGNYGLTIPERGALDRLRVERRVLGAPAPGTVRLRVAATGLNFRDVLNVLGMYPGDAGALGSEVAGTVEAVGEGVEGLAPGQRAIAITPAGFCSRVDAQAALTAPLPDAIPFGAGATIPIAFLTADWAMMHLGRLARGERVLIHAAAGGVGMAAVQLALAAGAEVHATAGSERKRAFLRALGVRHLYDSRSTAFREQVLEATGGEGVHVVLNSLADDFIGASFDAMRPDGRFLEIGKTGVWDAERVRREKPGAFYAVVYLGDACASEPGAVRARFGALMARFESGALRPLPLRRFALADAVAAFRYMAQAKHLGKVVVFDPAASIEADADAAGATWIVGGLSGLGLATAERLARAGRRRLVLTGRSEPSPAARETLDAMREAGADVRIETGDVSDAADVERILAALRADGLAPAHVIHAAGVLDDATLREQDWPRFERVLAPKALGAWNLHRATLADPVESFALYSAGAALFGSPGQANYAAANGFLDGLARARHAAGLPALSVAWGPWSETGMAVRGAGDWSARGIGGIRSDEGVEALRRLAAAGAVEAAVLPVDWPRFLAALPPGRRPPLFDTLGAAGGAPDAGRGPEPGAAAGGWLATLAAEDPARRAARLEALIAAQVVQVLGLDPGRPPSRRQGLTDMGMDSLMAVELSNRLGGALGRPFPSTTVFEHPTLEELSAFVAGEVLGDLPAPAGAKAAGGKDAGDAAAAEAERAGRIESEVRGMSEDEVESSLLDELDRYGY